jgi:hypothetical protein
VYRTANSIELCVGVLAATPTAKMDPKLHRRVREIESEINSGPHGRGQQLAIVMNARAE